MADNTTLNSGTGGDIMRSEDLGDGTKIQNVKMNIGDHGADGGPVSTNNPLPVKMAERPTYVANTGPITGATATGTKSLSYLWHPASETAKRYEIIRVTISIIAGTGGSQRIELRRITAENGTPGGTTASIGGKNPANASSNATVRIAPTGAPTRDAIIYLGGDVPVNLNGNAYIPPSSPPSAMEADEYTMRVSTAEGWEIVQQVASTITTAPVFNITWEWIEA